MKTWHRFILSFFILVSMMGCSTRLYLADTGTNEPSVVNGIVKYNALQKTLEQLAEALPRNERLAVVQVVQDAQNDLILDQVYEFLYTRDFKVAKVDEPDLKKQPVDLLDSFMTVRPTVFGVEHRSTRGLKSLYFLPLTVGGAMVLASPDRLAIAGGITALSNLVWPYFLQMLEHNERTAQVTLHVRLIDAKNGKLRWSKDFTSRESIRVKSMDEISF